MVKLTLRKHKKKMIATRNSEEYKAIKGQPVV